MCFSFSFLQTPSFCLILTPKMCVQVFQQSLIRLLFCFLATCLIILIWKQYLSFNNVFQNISHLDWKQYLLVNNVFQNNSDLDWKTYLIVNNLFQSSSDFSCILADFRVVSLYLTRSYVYFLLFKRVLYGNGFQPFTHEDRWK